MRDPLPWLPIQYKLPLTISVLSIVALCAGGYLVTIDARRALAERIRGDLDARALFSKHAIDARFELVRRRVEDFASDGFLRVEAAALFEARDSAARAAARERLVRHLELNKLPLVAWFRNAALVDANGQRVLVVDGAWPEFASASDGTTRFSAVLPAGSERSWRACAVTTPLLSLDGTRAIGEFQILLDLDRWLDTVDVSTAAGAESPAVSAGQNVLELHDPAGRSLPIGAVAARGARRATDAANVDGSSDDRWIRRELPLETAGWNLEIATDRDVEMAPLETLTVRSIGIGVAILLVNVVVLVFPGRLFVRPLLQLRRAAQAMTAGDETVRVPDTTSRDEIGDLSRAFNVMARAVEERSQRLENSARKLERQQALLRFERDRLDVLVRSMRDGLFILNEAGDVTFSNAAGHALVDGLASQSIQRERLLCAHAGSDDVGLPSCLGCLARFRPARGSCTVRFDGRVHEIHAAPLPSRPGRPAEAVYVSRDVTERVAAAEQHVHQERMHVIGELAAVVAHEVNNPLAAIVMFSQMLAESLEDDSALRRHAEVILRNADACRRTVSSLLEMAAFPKPEIGEFVLEEMLVDVAEFLRPLIARTSQGFELDLDREAIRLRGDEIQLRQVIVNLVMNSLQARADGQGHVTVRATRHGDRARIEVEDDGPGIPEAIRERIFEPFFSTKRPGAGTGLGLSTSRRIVEAHRGTLALVAPEPERTVFRVEIPGASAAAAIRRRACVVSPGAGGLHAGIEA